MIWSVVCFVVLLVIGYGVLVVLLGVDEMVYDVVVVIVIDEYWL